MDEISLEEDEPQRSIICECGQRKTDNTVEACANCRFLDGARCGARDVIAAFRTVGPLLCLDDITVITGLSYDNCSNIIRRLIRDGRARRVMSESALVDNELSFTKLVPRIQAYYELITWSPRVARAANRARRRRKGSRKEARA